ncbi:MAG: alkaline phosphatase, partial [Bacteroidota bacterium]|nr:alkaline phosphatase [Bacteroidota bacterium]
MRTPSATLITLLSAILLTAGGHFTAIAQERSLQPEETGSVIFIHPDGSGAGMYTALRLLDYGPDGYTAWDRLDQMGLYRSHQRNSASTTSHAGATVHAYGVKVDRDTYGSVPTKPVTALSGTNVSIMQEAMDAGMPVGVINSGHLCEPGTGVFLASAFSRYAMDSISAQIVESGADIILGGGEIYLLPEGTVGRHGEEGRRQDGRNMIERARKLGYAVVYTRDELQALPSSTEKVFGVFAAKHTFNDRSEEDLADAGLPQYFSEAPSVAEMTAAALAILENKGKSFFLVVEEEGSDNFANKNNASGSIEALRRADRAIAHAVDYIERHPATLLVTAADSDAGGMAIWAENSIRADEELPDESASGGALDGRDGCESLPFLSAP